MDRGNSKIISLLFSQYHLFLQIWTIRFLSSFSKSKFLSEEFFLMQNFLYPFYICEYFLIGHVLVFFLISSSFVIFEESKASGSI